MGKCSGCGAETDGKCWVDCGMSLCGAPLCENCKHVDTRVGSFRSFEHRPKLNAHSEEQSDA